MQVVDLRPGRRSSPPTLQIWASSAAELIHLAALLQHGDDETFDVGADRIDAVRSELPDELVDDITDETDTAWIVATRLVSLLDEPGDVDQLFALLEADPTIPWRAFVEEACEAAEIDPSLVDDHVAGDLSEDELEAALGDLLERKDAAVVRRLLGEPPAAFGERIRDVLGRLHEQVADTLLAEAMGPIRREATARQQQLADGVDVRTLVVEASNGYEAAMSTQAERILLLPSYWFRPWIICGRWGTTEVLSTAVADEHLVLPSQAPPPALVKLCKALGDEGRLRLLRRMAGGPIQLADAMEELDVAKTTAHHHLAILRQSGLVVVRGEGRGTTYGLRADPASTTQRMLAEYVGPGTAAALAGTGP